MKAEKFNEIVEEQFEICKETLGLKALDYASHSEDRLSQFKRQAAMTGSDSALSECLSLMGKHNIKLNDMNKSVKAGKHFTEAQWTEVIKDHINYLLLFKGLLTDEGEI